MNTEGIDHVTIGAHLFIAQNTGEIFGLLWQSGLDHATIDEREVDGQHVEALSFIRRPLPES